jgi:DNA-binding transcriptional MerR regulator
LDVPKHVLRFWEGKFPQLRPMKRGGGRRYYRPEDIDLLRGIRWLLYSDGYTIKGVQRILRDSGVRFVKECWRGDAKPAAEKKPQDKTVPIPNLAADAAREARKTKVDGTRGKRAEVAPAPEEESTGLSGGQRALLASLLNELEECRDMLRAASEPPARPKKSRTEQRRSV